jgi:hypothetical protein
MSQAEVRTPQLSWGRSRVLRHPTPGAIESRTQFPKVELPTL